MFPRRRLLFGVLLCALCWNATAIAEEPKPDSNGWHTWLVDEGEVSLKLCCYSWGRSVAKSSGCHLDSDGMSFSNDNECAAQAGAARVFVQIEDGAPRDIVVLSSNCPVSTDAPLIDHGAVSAVENLSWFRAIIENRKLDHDVRQDALFALVQSESDAAYTYLDRLLTKR